MQKVQHRDEGRRTNVQFRKYTWNTEGNKIGIWDVRKKVGYELDLDAELQSPPSAYFLLSLAMSRDNHHNMFCIPPRLHIQLDSHSARRRGEDTRGPPEGIGGLVLWLTPWGMSTLSMM